MKLCFNIILTAASHLKPRIWYGMPAYAASASTPVLVTLRHRERLSLAITVKSVFRPVGDVDEMMMPVAWSLDDETEKCIAEIVQSVAS